MRLEELEPGGSPLGYGQTPRYFRQDPARQWAAFVAGCWLVLMRERGVQFRQGARILISSQCSS
jgi:galactokinase